MNVMEFETALHPSDAELRDFDRGRMPAEEAAEIEEHLALCDTCCRFVETIPSDSFLGQLREARTAPPIAMWMASGDAPSDEPEELVRHPRYRVLRPLGRGGMGAVYLAEHRRMGRSVALKVINPEFLNQTGSLPRFQQEVKAAATLDHPNIVAAYDADQAGALHFLVMEYVEGQNLADYVEARGPLPIAQACDIIRQAALGLEHAHARGMVHRDIKPHNLMLTPAGQVKVLDFGLARLAAEPIAPALGSDLRPAALTSAGAVMGSADYIAPEQALDAHSADGRSDVYSLGCTLYYLLTGLPPFPDGTAPEKLRRHRTDAAPRLGALRADVPGKLSQVVAKMLAKKPENRYLSAADVAAQMAPFAKEQPKRSKMGRAWLTLAGLLLTALAVAGAAGIVRLPAGPDREVVIETDDPEIEVVVKGDRVVRIVDPKTKREYQLDRKELTISLFDDADGLSIGLNDRPIVLKRQGQRLAAVWVERKGPEAKAVPAPALPTITPAAPRPRIPLAEPVDNRLIEVDVTVLQVRQAERKRLFDFAAQRLMKAGMARSGGEDPQVLFPLSNSEILAELQSTKNLNKAITLLQMKLIAKKSGSEIKYESGGKFPEWIVKDGTSKDLPFGVRFEATPYLTVHDHVRLQIDKLKVSIRGKTDNLHTRAFELTFDIKPERTLLGLMKPAEGDARFWEEADSLGETIVLITPRIVLPAEMLPAANSEGVPADVGKQTKTPPPIGVHPPLQRASAAGKPEAARDRQIEVDLTHVLIDPIEAQRMRKRWGTKFQGEELIFGVLTDSGGFFEDLRDVRGQGKARTVSEPKIVTLNGRPAQFVTGAEIPIFATSSGKDAPVVSYKTVGDVCTVLPIALANGKIHLETAFTSSALDAANHVKVDGQWIPGFRTNGCQVAVQLEPGQTLAIGGFSPTDRKAAKDSPKERLILVTPRLLDEMAR